MPVRYREKPFGQAKPETPHGEIVIREDRCKGCGFCIEYCPHHVLVLSQRYNAKGYHPPVLVSRELCNGCNICGLLCPDFAIYGFINKKKKQ